MIIVTKRTKSVSKRRKLVAKLLPVTEARKQALGCLKGAIEILDEDFSLPEWSRSPTNG